MDTTDVNVLAQRIQELEKESARLKAILDKNGIEYKYLEHRICETNQTILFSNSGNDANGG